MDKKYHKPECIPSDMGGRGNLLDKRLSDVISLISDLPLDNVKTILDVGIGQGQLASHLAKNGKKVTGTGLEIDSYNPDILHLKESYNIDIVECNVEKMSFQDDSFDAVVMSHILEHCHNVGLALAEVRRVLKEDGSLIIFVPPHENYVCAGHVSVGWNVGQLMYVLLLNGFDVREGNFIEYGYNVCAFVKKKNIKIPALRGDRGDIHILNEMGLFPLPIFSSSGISDGYNGKIKSINWPNVNRRFVDRKVSWKHKIILKFLHFVPKKLADKIGSFFEVLGFLILNKENDDELSNPSFLK